MNAREAPTSASRRVAVIGTGSVGSALGEGLGAAGHAVHYGSRDPTSDAARALGGRTPNGAVATPVDAVAGADVVILAVPYAHAVATAEALAEAPGGLGDVVLVDATNPIGVAVEGAASGAELVARAVPGARVVKAFNTTGANNMRDPDYHGVPVDLHLCGDDADAKAVVAALGRDLGFEPLDCGSLAAAAQLEHLARLWVSLARGGLGREIAFKLLRRER